MRFELCRFQSHVFTIELTSHDIVRFDSDSPFVTMALLWCF
jgi:hypothetical protein